MFSGVNSTIKYNESTVIGKNKNMQDSMINTMNKYKEEVYFFPKKFK